MLSRRNGFNDRFERADRSISLFGRLFTVVWVLMFFGILAMFGTGVVLGYQCYASQDPNSFACWFVSDRVEIGVRQR